MLTPQARPFQDFLGHVLSPLRKSSTKVWQFTSRRAIPPEREAVVFEERSRRDCLVGTIDEIAGGKSNM